MSRRWDYYGTHFTVGEIYFLTATDRVSIHNICRYLDEKHNDQMASDIEDDVNLIEYVETKYFYDTMRYEHPVYDGNLF